jgi:aminocarboxymuconate-semialdehyde decarboxylase
MKQVTKIDVHNHVIPQSVLDLLRADPRYGVTFQNGRLRFGDVIEFPLSASFYDVEAKLAELRRHELDGAVISIAPPCFFYDIDIEPARSLCVAANEGMASFTAASPERFRWMAHVPMQAPEEAAAMLREAVSAGAVGVEIATKVRSARLDEPMFDVFWQMVDELSLLVMIHPYYNEPYPGLADWYLQNVIGNPLETTIAGVRLICAGTLDRWPRIKVLLVHGGGHFPYQLGRLRHAASVRKELAGRAVDPWSYAGKLKFDCLTHDSDALAYLADKAGIENVFIGTDLPFDMAPEHPVSMLRKAVGESSVLQVGARNPLALFGIG